MKIIKSENHITFPAGESDLKKITPAKVQGVRSSLEDFYIVETVTGDALVPARDIDVFVKSLMGGESDRKIFSEKILDFLKVR